MSASSLIGRLGSSAFRLSTSPVPISLAGSCFSSDSRVLEGRFSVDRFALGLPKGREAGLAYVRKFIENAKSEGLVKSAAERAGVRGAVQE